MTTSHYLHRKATISIYDECHSNIPGYCGVTKGADFIGAKVGTLYSKLKNEPFVSALYNHWIHGKGEEYFLNDDEMSKIMKECYIKTAINKAIKSNVETAVNNALKNPKLYDKPQEFLSDWNRFPDWGDKGKEYQSNDIHHGLGHFSGQTHIFITVHKPDKKTGKQIIEINGYFHVQDYYVFEDDKNAAPTDMAGKVGTNISRDYDRRGGGDDFKISGSKAIDTHKVEIDSINSTEDLGNLEEVNKEINNSYPMGCTVS